MKPFYVVLLMGAAAIGGGLVVRYSDHPVEFTLSPSDPPTVVAPPIPPAARVGPSSSVPVRSAPLEKLAAARPVPENPAMPEKPAHKPDKPSAFSAPKHVVSPEPAPSEPRPLARVRIPPDPPAVTFLERSTVASRVPMAAALPTPAPAPAPAPPAPVPAPVLPPPPPEANHATLKAGLLITVRVNQALSSNLNSPGDVFSGTLGRPLIADGFVIAERGANVRGGVVDSKSASGAAELAIRLRWMVASDVQRVQVVSEPWHKAGTASTSYAGNVYDAALTRGGAAVIRPATTITFRLAENVELTEKH
jgi:hypothetical protein